MAERYRGIELQEQAPNDQAEEISLTFTGSQMRQVTGRYPSLAVNRGGKLLEVHQPSFGLSWSDKIYYQVGTILDDLMTVRWSQEEKGENASGLNGKFARVALNNNNTVLIVCEKGRHVHYHVGSLSTKSENIQWTGQGIISWGRYPAVALNDRGQAVVAYEGNFSYKSYYRTAQLLLQGNSTINWTEERRLFTAGVKELSLTVNQAGCIVAVGHGSGNQLCFRVGTVPPTADGQNQFEINWEHDVENLTLPYCRPCISIDDAGNFTVVYQGNNGRQLYYQVGKVMNRRIRWQHNPRNYDMGCNPTVALSNGKWLEEHETNAAHRGHKLFYRVGGIHGNDDVKVQPPAQENKDKT